MSFAFVILAVLMAAAALACVLWPLLRRKLSPAPPVALVIALAFALPVCALGLYAWVGTPTALNAVAGAPAALDLDTAVTQLRARLEQTPGDVQGWVLLGRAYQSMQRSAEASAAFDRALAVQPDNADLLVTAAEARSLNHPDHLIDDAARAQLLKALAIHPDHQRALWLLGISRYQQQEYAGAIESWRRLLPLIDPRTQATVAAAVQEQIARAEAAMGLIDSSPPDAASTAPLAGATQASIEVAVSVDPAMREQVEADDAVFVYARAVDGPRMPLAVARLTVADLPAHVRLDDSMAMGARFKLSSFPRVLVFARISPSGQATPQPGDLAAAPAEVLVSSTAKVALVIDHPQDPTPNAAPPTDA